MKKNLLNYLPEKTYIEKEKLPELLRGILNGSEAIIDGTPLSMILLAIIYSFNEAFSHLNYTIYDKSVTKGEPITINMMVMMFYKSGGGKDFVVESCRSNMFGSIHAKISEIMYHLVEASIAELIDNLKKGGYKGNVYNRKYAEGVVQPVRNFYREGTAESIPSLARSVKKFNFGAINYWIGEFLQFYNTNNEGVSRFWWAIQQAFDKGSITGKSLKGESADENMSCIPVNVFASSTLDKYIESQNIQRRLKQDFVDGCSRRFYVCCPDQTEERQKPSDHFFDVRRKEESIDLLRFIGSNMLATWSSCHIEQLKRTITFSDASRQLFNEYERMCDDRLDNKFDGNNWKYNNELSGRKMRTMKLCGILALMRGVTSMNGVTSINEDDVCHAVYITEYYAQHYYRFTSTPVHGEAHRIFKYMAYHEGQYFNRAHFSALGAYESARDGKGVMFNDTIRLVGEIAQQNNCRLVEEKVKTTFQYAVVKNEDVRSPVTLSVSNHNSKGYRMISESFDNLNTIIIGKDKPNYSTFTFKNEYRNQLNSNKTNDIFILDVDEDLPLPKALEILKPYNCWVFTTRNHQKEKNKVVCDRYRIIFKLTGEFTYRDNTHYRAIIECFAKKHDISADSNCYEISRMYYASPPDAKMFRLHGKDLSLAQYDLTEALPASQCQSQLFKPLKPTQAGSMAEFEDWARKCFDANASVGNRNNTLFRIAAWAKDSGFTKSYWQDFVLQLDKLSPNPIGQKEIENTLFVSAKLR